MTCLNSCVPVSRPTLAAFASTLWKVHCSVRIQCDCSACCEIGEGVYRVWREGGSLWLVRECVCAWCEVGEGVCVCLV